MTMRKLPLGGVYPGVRILPLGNMGVPPGYRRLRGLGDDGDDGDDFSSFGDVDIGDNAIVNPVVTTNSIDVGTAPVIYDSSMPLDSEGPTYSGEVTALNQSGADMLASSILAGTSPLPTGSPVTAAQVAQLNAAGGTPDQLNSILSGQATYSQVMQALGAAASTASSAAKILSSSATGLRPSAVTCPTAPTGYSYTLNAAGQCQLVAGSSASASLSSLASSPWLWILLIGGVAVAMSQK